MNTERLKYKLFSAKKNLSDSLYALLEGWIVKGFFKKRDLLDLIGSYSHAKHARKQQLLTDNSGKKTLFFVFRGNQWLEHFIPLYRAFEKNHSGEVKAYFISHFYGDMKLQKYFMELYDETEMKLSRYGISPDNLFDYSEMDRYDNFPSPQMIFFSEKVNQIRFENCQRVYLPHYFLLKKKAKEGFSNIRNLDFDVMITPSKEGFFYTSEQINHHKQVVNILGGYPKSELLEHPKEQESNKIIFAPTLEKQTILSYLEEGLLDVFASMPEYHFVLKLHPSLNGGKSRIIDYIKQKTAQMKNISLDLSSAIDQLGTDSVMLIGDFGNVAAEYKVIFGKKTLYLKVPDQYEGGTDLLFRDRFAEGVCTIGELKETIKRVVSQQGNVAVESAGEACLYHFGHASDYIADEVLKLIK